ncbi:MAG: DUF3419 family protein [Gemmatimonadaceae bacterium]|nr:DUF3419 family protein [Gemmatimonadaceae bacterium]NUQ93948.1 DUF3419 family protein [Gemmatimonadaceae bacterium]NUR20791.1 DUF3419 family protein [Gemmatimonadaceae bacterium]NUS98481.1 DUF3419 family protein [Gemmatimonadaceae bacterium]
MRSEAAGRTDWSILRYAQCWEDADVLLGALEPRADDNCLSIASAGDNTLSLLASGAKRVIAVDLNPAQLAAVRLRVAAYRELSHAELLELMGSRPSARRYRLYERCRPLLDRGAREFWDARRDAIEAGIGGAGKFERYFAIFREWVLPLVHGRGTVGALLEPRDRDGRERFFAERWNSHRWRLLFRVFFSETVLGRLGRDPSFFRYAEQSVADHLMGRVRHALVELEPWENPYLHWILRGTHGEALPHALRAASFEAVRANIDRLELHGVSIEELISSGDLDGVDRVNFSNIFEYMSSDAHRELLERVLDVARPGARMAYWNMIVPRRGSDVCPDGVRPLTDRARCLFARDKAFFYSAFHVDEAR